jgi:hypothetical protein
MIEIFESDAGRNVLKVLNVIIRLRVSIGQFAVA